MNFDEPVPGSHGILTDETGFKHTVGFGCYVDGYNGQYSTAIALQVARDLGAPIEPHAWRAAWIRCAEQTYPSYQAFFKHMNPVLGYDSYVKLIESLQDEVDWAYDRAEMWLNDHTVGGYWGFEDGDFGLWQFEED